MCLDKIYLTCLECTKLFINTVLCFKSCINKNDNYLLIKNSDTNFILIEERLNNYDEDINKFYIDKDNEHIFLNKILNLRNCRVNYLFPIIIIDIDNDLINIQIQKKGEYFDLIGNKINRNMLRFILKNDNLDKYNLRIIDSDMKTTIIDENNYILLEKDNYKVI